MANTNAHTHRQPSDSLINHPKLPEGKADANGCGKITPVAHQLPATSSWFPFGRRTDACAARTGLFSGRTRTAPTARTGDYRIRHEVPGSPAFGTRYLKEVSMPAKMSIRFRSLTAGAARRTGNVLYEPSTTGHDPFGIPGEYARVFYPVMYLLWVLALASQIVELYWLPERRPAPSGYWPAHIAAYADFVIRFGGLAFGLTILLIPTTIMLVKLGRRLMTLATRIEDWLIPPKIREEIETGIAAGISEAVTKATEETRIATRIEACNEVIRELKTKTPAEVLAWLETAEDRNPET